MLKNLTIKIILFFLLVIPHVVLFAQENPLQKKITLSLVDKTLEECLNQISNQAGIFFSYNPKRIPIKQKVNLEAKDEALQSVLDRLFTDLPVNYNVVEGQIILRKAKQETEPLDIPKEKKFTLSGFIKEKLSGEILIGAVVYFPAINKGTVTNQYGFYSLTLPEGDYRGQFSFIGFNPQEFNVSLDENKILSPQLEEKSSLLEEVKIIVDETQVQVHSNQTGNYNLTPQVLSSIPTTTGESDLIKSLESIPGIKLFGDGSTSFFVRGGNRDQNLILLDEAPIFNPSHFLGFYSTFIPEAVKDIKIYKGDIPANYGGRLSSLIDVRTKDGNMQKFGASGNIGLISSRISLEGPIKKDKSSVFATFRKTHVAWILKKENPESNLYFFDLNGKFNYRFDHQNRFYLSWYLGQDGFVSNNNGITWGNYAATLRWNFVLNEQLFANTTVLGSIYNYDFLTSIEDNQKWTSTIATIAIKSDFTYYPNPDYKLQFGIHQTWYGFNPGTFTAADPSLQEYYPVVPSGVGSETTPYFSNHKSITTKLKFHYGIRIPLWHNIGETHYFTFDSLHNTIDTTFVAKNEKFNNQVQIEPRLGFSYKLSNHSSIKIGYARTTQFIQQISNSTSPFTTLEVWLPSSPNIKPQIANQISFSYQQQLFKESSLFSLEGYYKKMQNQIDYAEHAEMLLNPYIEGELRFGEGLSYGIETMFHKQKGKTTGWISYTFSRTFLIIDEINNGNQYPAFYDRPHQININLSHYITDRIQFIANWNYSTGSAITTPTGFYQYRGMMVPYYSEKNNDRLPNYHRLDVSLQFRLNKIHKKFEHYLNFNIYNFYNHKNYVFLNFNKVQNTEGELVIPTNRIERSDYSTSYIYLYTVFPSIMYKFNF